MLEVDISQRFGDFNLDVKFKTEAVGVTSLFGRSGAGKTSVINALAGLARPDRGRIAVNDEILFDSERGVDLPPHRRRLGYVFQDGRLFPHLTVRGNLNYGRRRTAEEGRRLDFDRVSDLLGLAPLLDRRPHNLSGGEKQRVAIGRALLASPRLLLMDEPLASLDAVHKAEILPFIERLRDALSLPVVYVSHTIDEIIRLADSVVLISEGRVAAQGPVEEVMNRFDLRPLTGRYEAGAVLAVAVAGQDEFGLTELSFDGGTLRVPHLDLPRGARLRVRIRARDVSLALARPADISILNTFAGRIVEIDDQGAPQVDLLLDIGAPLWARVTRRSVHDLGLAPGKAVHALIKAIAIDRSSVGGSGYLGGTREE